MKKLFIPVLIIFLIILTTGCTTQTDNDLVGTWTVAGFTVEIYPTGNGVIQKDDLIVDFTYKIVDENTVTLSNTLLGSYTFTYEIENENTITITFEGETYRIEKL